MDKTLFLLIPLIFFAAINSAAQTVAITTKEVMFKRPQPASEYKKTFVVNRPFVKAETAALSKKIEAVIGYETMPEFDLKKELGDFQWLEQANYIVDFNKNNVLAVRLLLEGSAAYFDSISKRVVVDTTTGARILPRAVFVNLAGLAAKCRQMQQAEMKRAVADYKKDPEDASFDASEYFNRAKFTHVELNAFSPGDKGVTFYYDYGFPHFAAGMQPDGAYFFRWSELKPFVKKDGVFGRFVE